MKELFSKSQRKFILAVFFALAGTAAFAFTAMTAAEWLALVAIVLGMYGAANVAEKAGGK